MIFSAASRDLSDYEGATVINARGVAVGEVESFTASPDGRLALLRLGGWQDFMGFLDFGGERAIVPVENFVFGPAATTGTTAVALTGE